MKFCPVCSSKLDDSATVCNLCGAVLNGQQEAGFKKGDMRPNGNMTNNSAYDSNRGHVSSSGNDDWGNGTIFINTNGGGSHAANDNPYEQQSQPYQQNNDISLQANKPYSGTSANEDWGNGTVFAGNDGYQQQGTPYSGTGVSNQTPVQNVQQKVVNGYAEQRINTPYTPPIPEDKKASKPKKAKKPMKNPFENIPIGTLILRIVLVVVIVVALIAGIVNGGF